MNNNDSRDNLHVLPQLEGNIDHHNQPEVTSEITETMSVSSPKPPHLLPEKPTSDSVYFTLTQTTATNQQATSAHYESDDFAQFLAQFMFDPQPTNFDSINS